MNKFKEYFQTNAISKIIFVLVILLVVLLIFQAGYVVGFRKAAFSFNWNNNYLSDIGDPHSIMAPFINDSDDVNPHGAVGEIIAINLPSILVKRSGGAEETINIGPGTEIRNFRQIATTSDLTLHKQVIVIGEANGNGQIDASLIRIIPPSPWGTTTPRGLVPPMMR